MKTASFFLIIFLCYSAQAQNSTENSGDSSRIIGHVYRVKALPSIALTAGGQLAILIAQKTFSKPEITDQEFDAAQLPASINSINALLAILSAMLPRKLPWEAVGKHECRPHHTPPPTRLAAGPKFRAPSADAIPAASGRSRTACFRWSPCRSPSASTIPSCWVR